MSRRCLCGWLLALLATLVACGGEARPPAGPLVLVVIDTLRRDALPFYGGETPTPNLSGLARRGITRPALASFHQTSMSMGAMFTGHTPSLESGDATSPLAWQPVSWCGMGRFTRDAQSQACLPDAVPTLGEELARRGWFTVGVVGNALLHDPAGFSRGFARWAEVGADDGDSPAGGSPRARARHAAAARSFEPMHEALRAQLEDLPDAPLFLYVHYLDVHDWLHLGRSYAQSVEVMDRGIGELLRILEERGLLAGATLLVTSDHGELIDDRARVLPHHPLHLGNPSYRDVLDVPFLLVGGQGAPLPALIRSEDVFRILLALASRDAAPAVRERSPELLPDELLVTEKLFRTYQQGRFKSIWRRGGEPVLVDLEADPGETRDVAGLHPEVLRRQRERIAKLSAALAADGLPTEHGDETPLDPEWVERLRSMGYVE